MIRTYKWLIMLAVFASACQVTKQYQRPELITENLYRSKVGGDTINVAAVSWQNFFADTLLLNLISTGLTNNIDLKIAVQNINAAHASWRQSKLAFLPDLNASTSIKQSKLAFPQGYGIISSTTQYDLGLTTSWEADIWGKLRSAKRGALAGLLQSEEAQKAIKTKLIADISGYYYYLLALDEQLLILEKTKENRIADVRTVKALKEANVVNGAAVVQSEANQYAAEVAIPRVKRQIRETENALSLLLAQPSGNIKRSSRIGQQVHVDLQTGIPSQLLQNRPDVKMAEYDLMMAFENTNIAKTMFYPALQLTAAGGFTSFNFKDWLTSLGLFGNIAAGITQPIFNKGRNKARLTTAQAHQEQAALALQKSLLMAGQEVSDALFSYQTAIDQQVIRTKQLASMEKSVDFNKKLLRYSAATNYTDVLTSEQNLLAAQMEGVNDRLQQWQALITLYRALGGGSN